MNIRKQIIAGLLPLLAVAGGFMAAAPGLPSTSTSGQLTMSKAPPQLYVPDELIVKFKPSVNAASQALSIRSTGATAIATLSQPGWVHIKLPPTLTVAQALTAYGGDPTVALAQPNYIYHALVAPNDTAYASQWALKNIGQTIATPPQAGSLPLYATNNPGTAGDDLDIEPAWDHITDCSTVTVAVVDSGVNYNQTELASSMWSSTAFPNHGWNFVNNNNNPMDLYGHGTHLAGIIGGAGNNGGGIAGVCWKASIMAVRVLDAAGTGTTATITQGVNFAVANGAKILNLSFGGPTFDPLFSDAITAAQTKGVIVVAAAGNEGLNNDALATPTYPCNFTQTNLICVAALDQKYNLATFSNYGATSVDVGAPGTNILSTWAGTGAVTADPLTSGWTFTTTTSGGWAFETLNTTQGPLQGLVDPTPFNPFNGALYNNSTDDRAHKTFSLTGDSAALLFLAAADLLPGDHFRVAYKSTGGDPFSGGTTALDVATGVSTLPSFVSVPLDVSGCISTTCSVGFQLQSDASGQAQGIAIAMLRLQTLTLNTTSFNTVSGTSLAAPQVTGVAAMLMAFNPSYTYADVINAIERGGRTEAALAGNTTTGNALDAMGALSYINPPAGLQVGVQ